MTSTPKYDLVKRLREFTDLSGPVAKQKLADLLDEAADALERRDEATVMVPSEAAVFWAQAVIKQQNQRMADLDYSAELYIGPVGAAEIILRLAGDVKS